MKNKLTPIFALVWISIFSSCSPSLSSKSGPDDSETGSSLTSPSAVVVQDGSEFVGIWRENVRVSNNAVYHDFARIEKNGESFLIRFESDSGSDLQGRRGVFPATYQNGILQTNNPMIGGIAYSSTDNSIFVSGAQFVKTSEQIEANRVAQERTEANAMQQAEMAQEEARQEFQARREAERRRIESISIHVSTCYTENAGNANCNLAQQDARDYPADVAVQLGLHNIDPGSPPWSAAVQANARANHTTPAGLASEAWNRRRLEQERASRTADFKM